MLIIKMPVAHTLERPPFRSEGARSPFARIESNWNKLASSLCQSSDRGLWLCKVRCVISADLIANYQPTAANIARRPCLTSASLIQYKVFLDLENPRGSNPTSPASVPSRANGAFTPPIGSHFAARATGLVTLGGCGITGSSKTDSCNEIELEEILVC